MAVGMVTEVEGRETPRCQFRLSMARRHEEHKAINADLTPEQWAPRMLPCQGLSSGDVSPRRPSSTMRIFSSAAWCFRVARRMSRTSVSDDAGVEFDFCLIFAP